MAANRYDPRRRVISKHYRRLFDYAERQVFQGPPENFKDSIMQASRALMQADWHQCIQLLTPLKLWDLLPNSTEIKVMLEQKVKEEAVRVYLFTYGSYFETLSLQSLAEQFQLPFNAVYSSVSRLILGDELQGTIEEQTGMLSLANVQPSKLQYLALQACDKLNVLVESNEKMFEFKTQQPFMPSSSSAHARQSQQGGQQQQQSRYPGGGIRRPSQSSSSRPVIVGH
jgi:translation initiation factor 3 subunit C